MMTRSARRRTLFHEMERAHRKWEVAKAIGATPETKNILARLADSRHAAFRRALQAEKEATQ